MTDDPAQSSDIEVGPGVFVPSWALRFHFARSGGPGGQNVNKLNTKAELWIRPESVRGLHPEALTRLRNLAGKRLTKLGEIHLTAEAGRTREQNRSAVLEKLRELLVAAMHRPKVRKKPRPGRAAKERRIQDKKKRSEIKSHRRGAMD